MRYSKIVLLFTCTLLFLLSFSAITEFDGFVVPVFADISDPWFDSSWQKRMPFVIDNTQVSGSSSLSNFPVLISLNGTDFSSIESSILPSGNDIRFADNTGTLLSYEIEKFAKIFCLQ